MPKSLEELQAKQRTSQKVSTLLYGRYGTGKTVCAATGIQPVLIDCFDPGGGRSRLISDRIAKGNTIIIDDRWTTLDAKAVETWEMEMEERIQSKMFDKIGTYVLDSYTTWSTCVLMYIAKKTGGAAKKGSVSPIGQILPGIPDYNYLIYAVTSWLSRIMQLPCNFVLTGHIEHDKDEATGAFLTGISAPGKVLPQDTFKLFDEIYVSMSIPTSTGPDYKLLTKNDGMFQARTRIGGGIFETYEQPDLKALLRKAGLSDANIDQTKKGA